MSDKIIRGTTPTIQYTFKTILPADIDVCRLVISEKGEAVIDRDEGTATIGENTIEWTLTQEETLSLDSGALALIKLDWLTIDGTRGTGKTCAVTIGDPAVDEVL